MSSKKTIFDWNIVAEQGRHNDELNLNTEDTKYSPENEEHDEEDGERIDHLLTPSTSNSTPTTNTSISSDNSIDAQIPDNNSEEDLFPAFESINSAELKMDISYDYYNTNMQENPSDNAFVMKSKGRQSAVVPEYNHLQVSQNEKKEPQENEPK